MSPVIPAESRWHWFGQWEPMSPVHRSSCVWAGINRKTLDCKVPASPCGPSSCVASWPWPVSFHSFVAFSLLHVSFSSLGFVAFFITSKTNPARVKRQKNKTDPVDFSPLSFTIGSSQRICCVFISRILLVQQLTLNYTAFYALSCIFLLELRQCETVPWSWLFQNVPISPKH